MKQELSFCSETLAGQNKDGMFHKRESVEPNVSITAIAFSSLPISEAKRRKNLFAKNHLVRVVRFEKFDQSKHRKRRQRSNTFRFWKKLNRVVESTGSQHASNLLL